ncbi:MAG: response regulator [Proteobacteria bacterium]|nr:response regulator [Pseudomonadota bacterium]
MITILLVDDDELQRKIFTDILEEAAYEVISVDGGEEALKVVEDFTPDLILLDVIMPRVGGIETCKVMRSFGHLRTVPIIMLTAMDSDDYIVDALDAGADDFIIKKSSPRVVCARLRAHLRTKSLHDEVERLRRDQNIITESIIEVNYNDDLGDALQRITEKISRQIGGRVSIVNIKKGCGTGSVIATSDGMAGEQIVINLDNYPELRYAVENKRPLIIEDISNDAVVEGVADKLKDLDVSSLMVIPLPFEQKNDEVGVLLLRARGSYKAYDQDDSRLCRTIADAVAHTIKAEKLQQSGFNLA